MQTVVVSAVPLSTVPIFASPTFNKFCTANVDGIEYTVI